MYTGFIVTVYVYMGIEHAQHMAWECRQRVSRNVVSIWKCIAVVSQTGRGHYCAMHAVSTCTHSRENQRDCQDTNSNVCSGRASQAVAVAIWGAGELAFQGEEVGELHVPVADW